MEQIYGMRLIQGSKKVNGRNVAPLLKGMAGSILCLLAGSRGLRETEEKQMRLLETLSLGGKRQLMLVGCGEEQFLVGGSVDSVDTIVPIKRGMSPESANK